MKTIELKIPDEFTDDQIDFIKKSALNQIKAELKATLTIPQKDIDAVNVKIAEVETAMGLKEAEVKDAESGLAEA
jgi:hypothetical protein